MVTTTLIYLIQWISPINCQPFRPVEANLGQMKRITTNVPWWWKLKGEVPEKVKNSSNKPTKNLHFQWGWISIHMSKSAFPSLMSACWLLAQKNMLHPIMSWFYVGHRQYSFASKTSTCHLPRFWSTKRTSLCTVELPQEIYFRRMTCCFVLSRANGREGL